MNCELCATELSPAEVEVFTKAAEHCTPDKVCTACQNKYRGVSAATENKAA